MLPCLVFAVAGSAAVAGAAGAQAQSGDEVIVPLTDPSRPAVVSVGAFAGNIVVRGTAAEYETEPQFKFKFESSDTPRTPRHPAYQSEARESGGRFHPERPE